MTLLVPILTLAALILLAGLVRAGSMPGRVTILVALAALAGAAAVYLLGYDQRPAPALMVGVDLMLQPFISADLGKVAALAALNEGLVVPQGALGGNPVAEVTAAFAVVYLIAFIACLAFIFRVNAVALKVVALLSLAAVITGIGFVIWQGFPGELRFEALVLFLLLSFILLIFSGFPIAWLLAGLSFLFVIGGLYLHDIHGLPTNQLRDWGSAFGLIPNRVWPQMDNWVLLALPMFIYMGLMLERSGVAERLMLDFIKVFGRFHGGLALAVVLIGILFAASTGIVGASVVLLATLSVPIMLREGYSKKLASGVVAASGTLGILIPPSIMLVLMADQASLSVGNLFMGALAPGLLLGILYLTYVIGIANIRPSLAPVPKNLPPVTRQVIFDTLLAVLPPILLILAVLGSIFAGIATPTEAAGLGAFGAMVVAFINNHCTIAGLSGFFRNLFTGNMKAIEPQVGKTAIEVARFQGTIVEVGRNTTLTTAFIFGIFLGATVFALTMRQLGGDEFIKDLIFGLTETISPEIVIILILLLVFAAGFFLDWLEITLIFLPLLAEPVGELVIYTLGLYQDAVIPGLYTDVTKRLEELAGFGGITEQVLAALPTGAEALDQLNQLIRIEVLSVVQDAPRVGDITVEVSRSLANDAGQIVQDTATLSLQDLSRLVPLRLDIFQANIIPPEGALNALALVEAYEASDLGSIEQNLGQARDVLLALPPEELKGLMLETHNAVGLYEAISPGADIITVLNHLSHAEVLQIRADPIDPARLQAIMAQAQVMEREQLLTWFLILFAVTLQTSFLTPPVGFSLFYLKGVVPPEVKTTDIYIGIIPFVLLQLGAIILVFWYPKMVLYLPSLQ